MKKLPKYIEEFIKELTEKGLVLTEEDIKQYREFLKKIKKDK